MKINIAGALGTAEAGVATAARAPNEKDVKKAERVLKAANKVKKDKLVGQIGAMFAQAEKLLTAAKAEAAKVDARINKERAKLNVEQDKAARKYDRATGKVDAILQKARKVGAKLEKSNIRYSVPKALSGLYREAGAGDAGSSQIARAYPLATAASAPGKAKALAELLHKQFEAAGLKGLRIKIGKDDTITLVFRSQDQVLAAKKVVRGMSDLPPSTLKRLNAASANGRLAVRWPRNKAMAAIASAVIEGNLDDLRKKLDAALSKFRDFDRSYGKMRDKFEDEHKGLRSKISNLHREYDRKLDQMYDSGIELAETCAELDDLYVDAGGRSALDHDTYARMLAWMNDEIQRSAELFCPKKLRH